MHAHQIGGGRPPGLEELFMKFICDKAQLITAISTAGLTVAQRSTIPALEGICLTAGMKLSLTGYNLETGITVEVPAEITEPGSCVMPTPHEPDHLGKDQKPGALPLQPERGGLSDLGGHGHGA